MLSVLLPSLELGLLYSLVVLGVFLTFTIVRFPDLTVDGSFVTGACIAAALISHGISGYGGVLLGGIFGCGAGFITYTLHTQLRISPVLSGILTLGILYTLNLRIMGAPNSALFNKPQSIGLLTNQHNHYLTIIFLLSIVVLIKIFLDWFLHTELGLRIRATGDNEKAARALGIDIQKMKLIVLCLSNGLVGMAGALVAQYQGFADIHMGAGIILLGLVPLIFAQCFDTASSLAHKTALLVVCSIFYHLILNVSLRLGLSGTDIKCVTALIFILALLICKTKNNFLIDEKIFAY